MFCLSLSFSLPLFCSMYSTPTSQCVRLLVYCVCDIWTGPFSHPKWRLHRTQTAPHITKQNTLTYLLIPHMPLFFFLVYHLRRKQMMEIIYIFMMELKQKRMHSHLNYHPLDIRRRDNIWTFLNTWIAFVIGVTKRTFDSTFFPQIWKEKMFAYIKLFSTQASDIYGIKNTWCLRFTWILWITNLSKAREIISQSRALCIRWMCANAFFLISQC